MLVGKHDRFEPDGAAFRCELESVRQQIGDDTVVIVGHKVHFDDRILGRIDKPLVLFVGNGAATFDHHLCESHDVSVCPISFSGIGFQLGDVQ